MPDKKVVLVLGMHRSGTSMLTNILAAAGFYLGEQADIMPANQFNQKGYFESWQIVETNDLILDLCNGNWNTPPPEQDVAQINIRPRLEKILSPYEGHDLVVLKDPRMCLTLPVWREVLPENLSVVYIKRSVEAVAKSLARRDGFPLEKGRRLWEEYNQRAEKYLHGYRHFDLHYEDLFSERRSQVLGELADFLEIDLDLNGLAEQIVDAKLDHSAITLKGGGDGAAEQKYLAIKKSKIDKGLFNEARQALEKLVKEYPEFSIAYNDLGVLYLQQKKVNEALLAYKKAVQLQPENMIFQKNLADFYYVILGQLEEALQGYRHILAKCPEDTEVLFALGCIFAQLRQFHDACDLFERVLAIDPGHESARQELEACRLSEANQALGSGSTGQDADLAESRFLSLEGGGEGVRQKVSIIIPVFNKLNYTRKCLESLQENTEGGTYELIFVDNASTDGTAEFLDEFTKDEAATVLSNSKNAGFAKACNQGARAATTPYLLFLNNDTEPQKDWLEPLLDVLDQDPDVAAVGSKLLFPDGTIQHAGVIAIDDRKLPDPLVARHVYYQKPAEYGPANVAKTYPVLTAASLLVRRDLFEKVGGFDEGYWNGYEDVDLCFKLGEMGYSLVYQPASVLIHHESVSGPERFAKVDRNIERLHSKWIDKVRPDLIIEPDGEVRETHANPIRHYSLPNRIDIKTATGDDIDSKYARLQKLIQTRPEEEAIATLQELLAMHQDFALGHNDLGVLFLKKGEADKALAHFLQATALAPANTTFQKNLAEYYLVLAERPDLALEVYSKILASAPGDSEILLGIGHCCRLLGRPRDAADFFRQILKLEPENQDALHCLAELDEPPPAGLREREAGVTQIVQEESKMFSSSVVDGVVSMVILTFNQLPVTKECVASIQKHTPEPHEIIFVDNGSHDGTVKWLRKIVKENPNYQLVENRQNLGFAKGCNQGVEASRGEYVLLLNNDVVVTAGWLAGLLECHGKEPKTGIVGPMTNNISGVQKVPKVDYDRLDQLDQYAAVFRARYRHRRIPARRLVGFCMLFKRELADEIGLLDESFGTGNFEDDDFCLRAVLAGYRNVIAGDVFIHHHGSASFIGNRIDYAALMGGNRGIFLKKWQDVAPDSLVGRRFIATDSIEKAKKLHQQGQVDQALELLTRVIKLSPEEPAAYQVLAGILLEEGRHQQARELLESMPARARTMRSVELLAAAKIEVGEIVEVEEALDHILQQEEQAAGILNLKGVLAYKGGQADQAEEYFRLAMKSDPGLGEPCTNLGLIRWKQNRQEEALELLERGFALDPMNGEAMTNYHAAASGLSEFARSRTLFYEAVSLHPYHYRLRNLLIDVLLRLQEYGAALQEIEHVLLHFGIDEGMLGAAGHVRDLVGPMQIEEGKAKGSVTLCMIVKNEERHLVRCLASVKPVVDEMVIVDTGSSDKTREIAKVFGARVYDFAWTGDFSAARNFSLEQAKGDWILVMDADEVIAPQDYQALRSHARQTKRKGGPKAYTIITRNYMTSVNTVGWTPNDGRYAAEEEGFGWFPSDKVRFFPNDPKIRFEYPVHELVDHALRRHNYRIELSSVVVHHYGKLDAVKTAAKGEEYYKMGLKKLEEEGDSPVALRELGTQAMGLGRYEEGVGLFKRWVVSDPGNGVAHVNLAAAYWEGGDYGQARQAALKARELAPAMKEAQYNYAVSELCLGRAEKARPELEALLAKMPDYIVARFMLGATLCALGEEGKGVACFEQVMRHLKVGPEGIGVSIEDILQRLLAGKQQGYGAALCRAAEKLGIKKESLRALCDGVSGGRAV